MILFFAAETDEKTASLIESEAIHCRQALRKKEGDIINVTDGKGNAFTAKITAIAKKSILTQKLEKLDLQNHRNYRIHIGIAPTKNISRFEWFLEKATELGIDEITPLLCQRSERKIIKEDRLTKILISAMKQSLKPTLPILNKLTKLNEFVEKQSHKSKFIAHLEGDATPLLINAYKSQSDVLILIGPEGDFTREEINLAQSHNFNSVSLGDYRLRTETAGIASVQAIHFCNQKRN